MQRPLSKAALLAALLRERFGDPQAAEVERPDPDTSKAQAQRRDALARGWKP